MTLGTALPITHRNEPGDPRATPALVLVPGGATTLLSWVNITAPVLTHRDSRTMFRDLSHPHNSHSQVIISGCLAGTSTWPTPQLRLQVVYFQANAADDPVQKPLQLQGAASNQQLRSNPQSEWDAAAKFAVRLNPINWRWLLRCPGWCAIACWACGLTDNGL